MIRRLLLGTLLLASTAWGSVPASWRVTGTISHLPGFASRMPFTCTVTEANPRCDVSYSPLSIGILEMRFAADDDPCSFRLYFVDTWVCGQEASMDWTKQPCHPRNWLTDFDPEPVTMSCEATACVVTNTDHLYFPCTYCFGGEKPVIDVAWRAVASGTCNTTSTTTSTSTTTTTTTTSTTTTTVPSCSGFGDNVPCGNTCSGCSGDGCIGCGNGCEVCLDIGDGAQCYDLNVLSPPCTSCAVSGLAACNDSDPCTADTCDDGVCSNTPIEGCP